MAQDGERQIQMAMPAPARLFTPGVVTLLVLMLAGCILTEVWPAGADALLVHPGALFGLELWRLATYPFYCDLFGFIAGGLLMVFLGSALEREWRALSLIHI